MNLPDPRSETLPQFLVRREHELTALISALEGQMGPLKAELAALKRMKELADTFVGFGLKADLHREEGKSGVTVSISDPDGVVGRVPDRNFIPPPRVIPDRFFKMTIKELAVQALIDNFPSGGTLAQIREYIQNGYVRAVELASLRAQMHRMKADEIVTQDGEIWNLVPRKRHLYGMYNHPTSRAAMQELKDEPEQRNYAQELREQFGSALDPDHPDFPRSPNDIPNNPPLPAVPKTQLEQARNEEADRLAQKEAKRARKRGEDFLE